MNSNIKLRATVFNISGENTAQSNKDIWKSIAERVCRESKGAFSTIPEKYFSIAVQDSCSKNANRPDLVHFKTVQANIIRVHGQMTLIELSAGNLFCSKTKNGVPGCALEQNLLNTVHKKHSVWIRNKSSISLTEHIRIVTLFLNVSRKAGINLQETDLDVVRETSKGVFLRNGTGVQAYQPGINKNLLKNPLRIPPPWTLAVVYPYGQRNLSLKSLMSSFKYLLAGHSGLKRVVSIDRRSVLTCDESVLLFALKDNEELRGSEAEYLLQRLESEGKRFKLSRCSSIDNRFAADNIAYDLFLLSGGIPWIAEIPEDSPHNFIAFDAGHNVEKSLSRWVSCLYQTKTNEVKIRHTVGKLAEHINSSVLDAIWPLISGPQDKTAVLRDGRFLREARHFFNKYTSESVYTAEVTKHPKAVLFRGEMGAPTAPYFGDSLKYPDGSILLQTLEVKKGGYQRPLRIKNAEDNGITGTMVNDITSLCKAPSLGLYQTTKYPAVIYWADLCSKLNYSGWAKAIGRGFGLSDCTSLT